MQPTLSNTLGAAVLALTAFMAPLHAAAAPVPVEHFFENSAFSGAKLSPDARSLAVLVSHEGSRDRLAVIDLATNKGTVVANFEAADIGTFQWVNNKRLAFNSHDKRVVGEDMRWAPGIYAVNRDGTEFKQLAASKNSFVVEMKQTRGMLSYNHYLMSQTGAQNSNSVYVLNPRFSETDGHIEAMNLVQLDTDNGRGTTLNRPGNSRSWMLDASGEPRLSIIHDKNVETIMYLDPATKEWRKLASFDSFVGSVDDIYPLGFAPDGTLYVLSNGGKDFASLHTFDFKTNKINPTPVVSLDGFDFDGRLLTSNGRLLGVRYTNDATATVWFDDKMKAVQKAVDALLPGTNNLLSVAPRAELPLILVVAYSDRQPSNYLLYNTETGKLNPIGSSYPKISPRDMGEQEFVRIKARDGNAVPTWLTLPAGGKRKNLPMVVLVHGGPYVRGNAWGWDANDQFLASRGYAVLQPEFRGSTGYGAKHFRNGFKQWGLAMQNDIADATRWAIAEGIADPKRICIAGASYGGYAALMGLINDPDLYKCGINWVGVTDLTLLSNGHWSFKSDLSEAYKKYGMPELVGDPIKDAAQFKATSPIQQAARITQPLLMAYGTADERVPLYHGRMFHDAVKKTNPRVEMVEYKGEGHGWAVPKNRFDFWTRVEKFLEKNIGTP